MHVNGNDLVSLADRPLAKARVEAPKKAPNSTTGSRQLNAALKSSLRSLSSIIPGAISRLFLTFS